MLAKNDPPNMRSYAYRVGQFLLAPKLSRANEDQRVGLCHFGLIRKRWPNL
jgi:hypothetical protein